MILTGGLAATSLALRAAEEESKPRFSAGNVLLFFTILLAMFSGINNPDYSQYELQYNEAQITGSYNGSSVLLGFFELIFAKIGFGFSAFRFCYLFAGLLILVCFAKKVLTDEKLIFPFLILYAIFPMVLDNVQLKNFMAEVIVLNALTIFFSKRKHKFILYELLILLASGFHQMALLFAPFGVYYVLLHKAQNKTKTVWALVSLFIASFFCFPAGRSLIASLAGTVFGATFVTRYGHYFETQMRYGPYVFVLLAVSLWLFTRYFNKKNSLVNPNSKETRACHVLFLLLGYSFLFLPLYFIDSETSRMIRDVLPFVHCVFLNVMASKKLKVSKPIAFIFYMLGLVYMVYWMSHWDTVVVPFVQNLF